MNTFGQSVKITFQTSVFVCIKLISNSTRVYADQIFKTKNIVFESGIVVATCIKASSMCPINQRFEPIFFDTFNLAT